MPAHDIDPELVRRVALLARLDLPAADLDRAADQLTSVIGHFQALQGVDTTGVEPLVHALDNAAAPATDVIAAWPQPRTTLLPLTTHAREGFFVVPRVMEADFGAGPAPGAAHGGAAASRPPETSPEDDPGADA